MNVHGGDVYFSVVMWDALVHIIRYINKISAFTILYPPHAMLFVFLFIYLFLPLS